jgi:hypothetical protein
VSEKTNQPGRSAAKAFAAVSVPNAFRRNGLLSSLATHTTGMGSDQSTLPPFYRSRTGLVIPPYPDVSADCFLKI